MNFLKTAGAVAAGIVLSEIVKDVFGRIADGAANLSNRKSDTPTGDKPAGNDTNTATSNKK